MNSEVRTKTFFTKKHRFLPVLLFLVACGGGPSRVDLEWRGQIFGTFYRVKAAPVDGIARSDIQQRIDTLLQETDRQMSNWLPESEVSRFNRHTSTEPFPVSPETAAVTARSIALHEATGGAFDPTLSPLIELWGFGTKKDVQFPSPEAIEASLETIGVDKLAVGDNSLLKTHADLALNLSAIAKGFAVDRLAEMLAEAGFSDYMVNIGGEVRVKGLNPKGTPWRMAVERPASDAGQEIYAVFDLDDKALATSGDYRNFFVHEGQRYSHIIDPRTGYPVTHHIASASVIAPDCMTADALATALLVATPEEGIAMIEKLTGVECLILVREADDTLTEHASSGLADHRVAQPD